MVTRKLIKNGPQYKLTVPVELVRKLGLEKNNSLIIKEVDTSKGKGFVVLRDDESITLEDVS